MTVDECIAKAAAKLDSLYGARIREIVEHMIDFGADDD
jgi:hypothetical protein